MTLTLVIFLHEAQEHYHHEGIRPCIYFSSFSKHPLPFKNHKFRRLSISLLDKIFNPRIFVIHLDSNVTELSIDSIAHSIIAHLVIHAILRYTKSNVNAPSVIHGSQLHGAECRCEKINFKC